MISLAEDLAEGQGRLDGAAGARDTIWFTFHRALQPGGEGRVGGSVVAGIRALVLYKSP